MSKIPTSTSRASKIFSLQHSFHSYRATQFAMFSIVKFHENGEFQDPHIIPSSWIVENTTRCWWPDNKDTNVLKKLILNCAVVQTNRWIQYNCQILGSYNTYDAAAQSMISVSRTNKYHCSTNLNSLTRKRKPQLSYSDDSQLEWCENDSSISTAFKGGPRPNHPDQNYVQSFTVPDRNLRSKKAKLILESESERSYRQRRSRRNQYSPQTPLSSLSNSSNANLDNHIVEEYRSELSDPIFRHSQSKPNSGENQFDDASSLSSDSTEILPSPKRVPRRSNMGTRSEVAMHVNDKQSASSETRRRHDKLTQSQPLASQNGGKLADVEKRTQDDLHRSPDSDFSKSVSRKIDQMMRTMEKIAKTQEHILATQARQSAILNSILQKYPLVNSFESQTTNRTPTKSEIPDYDLNNYDLPLKTLDDLEQFEQRLDDEDYRKRLMIALSKIGGVSISNGTTRVLTRIMTDELASQFCYKGRSSGKHRFEHLHLCQVAKDAVRIQKKFADFDESSVEDKIKSWLRHAPGRMKSKRITGEKDGETRGGN